VPLVTRVSFSKQPHWITASYFLLKVRFFKAVVTETEHLPRTNDYHLSNNSASLSAIITLSESPLVVEVSSEGCWFSRHWRDNLSNARFTFAVNWRRWTFTPAWSLLAAFCRRIARPPSQSEEPESTRCVASATAACALPLYCACWRNSEKKTVKKNNVVQPIEIMFPMARQQKQRGSCGSNTNAGTHGRTS